MKSANVFVEDDIPIWPDKAFAQTITMPVLQTIATLSKLTSLEISGQENLTPEFGRAIRALHPSFIGSAKRATNKNHAFSLRITGARCVWSGAPDPTEEFRRNKDFLDALNANSVTSIDFDITDDWGWDLDCISEFLLRQARSIKAIRIRGVGDTVSTWQLLDRMGQRGCRVRGLDLENRHVHHPPVMFETTAWAFKSGLLKKLKYLAIEGFQGITNSTTNYHMIDPTSFSILLKHNLFGGRSSGNRITPPIKTLVLKRTKMAPKIPEQIGAFVMHLAPTLTTLEIGYSSTSNADVETPSGAYIREQGRYKLIDVLMKLEKLKRLRASGYAAETLLCSCIRPGYGFEVDGMVSDGDGAIGSEGIISRPCSPPRPSTPVPQAALEAGGSGQGYNSAPSPPSPRLTPAIYRSRYTRPPPRAPGLRLFRTTWRHTLEELELEPSSSNVFEVYGGLTDESLEVFQTLKKLRVLTLLWGRDDDSEFFRGIVRNRNWNRPSRPSWRGGDGTGRTSDEDSAEEDGRSRRGSGLANSDGIKEDIVRGKITPEGIAMLAAGMPRMELMNDKLVLQKLWISRRFLIAEASTQSKGVRNRSTVNPITTTTTTATTTTTTTTITTTPSTTEYRRTTIQASSSSNSSILGSSRSSAETESGKSEEPWWWPLWAIEIAEVMRIAGAEFELV